MAADFTHDRMASRRLQLSAGLGWAALALALALLVLSSLYLAADAEGLGQRFAPAYPYVFGLAAAALLTLTVAILQRLWRLRRDVRNGVPGARLSRRLLLVLLMLALPPVGLVYAFGARFIAATVDTWFTANSAQALDQALVIGRLFLDDRLQAAEQDAKDAARQLANMPDAALSAALDTALDDSQAEQLAVYADGRLRAIAAANPQALTAAPPSEDMRLAISARGHYADTEVVDGVLRLRVLQPLEGVPRGRVLQGLYGLPADYAQRLAQVEASAAAVRQANYLRDSLKLAFQLILTMVLLVSVLLAILLAIDVARRMVAPIARLAAANREVAEGRLDARLPDQRDDELGLLARSFNRMVADLQTASEQAQRSAEETERQRAFLQTVLSRLTSGVLVVDAQARLRSCNAAAAGLLGCQPDALLGEPLEALIAKTPLLRPLLERILDRLREGVQEFREEVALPRDDGRQLLLLRGARLPDDGLVAVFDDTTEVDRARRDAAWAEVARRLAHEVKNPLTPIQLAAERLRRRVMPKLDSAEADVVDRATNTIVAQVEALKTMVNAFGEYASPPTLRRATLDLNALVREVLDLYADDTRQSFSAQLAPDLPSITADAGRLRQVLHNLIKNAQEASAERTSVQIEVATLAVTDGDLRWVDLVVTDHGPGLPAGFDPGWYEPYRTTKTKGTGLGLAIVRKIAEEHGGQLHAQTASGGGARFSLRLPV
jgi:PAS domain S-box-containing protein